MSTRDEKKLKEEGITSINDAQWMANSQLVRNLEPLKFFRGCKLAILDKDFLKGTSVQQLPAQCIFEKSSAYAKPHAEGLIALAEIFGHSKYSETIPVQAQQLTEITVNKPFDLSQFRLKAAVLEKVFEMEARVLSKLSEQTLARQASETTEEDGSRLQILKHGVWMDLSIYEEKKIRDRMNNVDDEEESKATTTGRGSTFISIDGVSFSADLDDMSISTAEPDEENRMQHTYLRFYAPSDKQPMEMICTNDDTAHALVKYQVTRMTESAHNYASNMDNMYSIHFPELEEDQEKQKSHLLEIKFDEQVRRFCCCCCCFCCCCLLDLACGL